MSSALAEVPTSTPDLPARRRERGRLLARAFHAVV